MSLSNPDEYFMARALQLAEHGLYTTDPNPRVGCVLVKEGAVIGEGWHRCAGQPHAEVNALAEAGGQAGGATAYVTLEPCSHTGKTPPCCDALITAGVSRVVAAMQDPNPQVAGDGFARLRAAGIEVFEGVCQTQSRVLNPGFIKRMEQGLPWIRCKMAMSLDGRTAMASGESQWITGPAARRDVQRLRARSSAVVTGVGSILHDDSSLNVRNEELGLEVDLKPTNLLQPLRVVVDSRFRTPLSARVLGVSGSSLVVGAQENEGKTKLENAGVTTLLCRGEHGQVDLHVLAAKLAQRQCNELMVEAGATLSGAFVQAGLVDELIIYMAPKLMGDAARPLFKLPNLDKMSDQIKLIVTQIRSVGDDWRISAQVDFD